MKRSVAITFSMLGLLTGCSSGKSNRAIAPPSPAGNGLVAQVASYDLAVGNQRFLVGLLTNDRRLVGYGTVQLRLGYLGQKAQGSATMGPPITANFLPVPSTDGSRTPAKPRPEIIRGSAVTGVYSARAGFDRAGFWGVLVTARLKGQEPQTAQAAFEVLEKNQVPGVGLDAPRSENLTVASAEADAPRKAIDSRATGDGAVPDEQLHLTTVAQAIAQRKPMLLAISTPVYCVSRFCGPVTEMVAGLAARYSDRAAFAHLEVWRDYEKKEINKAAAEWILKGGDATEPWVFLIGADGKIAARWDNVVTAGEIEPLLQQLPRL